MIKDFQDYAEYAIALHSSLHERDRLFSTLAIVNEVSTIIYLINSSHVPRQKTDKYIKQSIKTILWHLFWLSFWNGRLIDLELDTSKEEFVDPLLRRGQAKDAIASIFQESMLLLRQIKHEEFYGIEIDRLEADKSIQKIGKSLIPVCSMLKLDVGELAIASILAHGKKRSNLIIKWEKLIDENF